MSFDKEVLQPEYYKGDSMKRILSVIGILVLGLSLVGWKGQGGWKADNQWSGNLYFWSNVVATGHKAGITTNVSTSSTLTSAALGSGVISMIGHTSAKTIGLNDGVPGQMVTIILTLRQGANVIISKTSFPVTTHSTGWNTLTFDTEGDSITLLFMSNTIGWIRVGNDGVVVA